MPRDSFLLGPQCHPLSLKRVPPAVLAPRGLSLLGWCPQPRKALLLPLSMPLCLATELSRWRHLSITTDPEAWAYYSPVQPAQLKTRSTSPLK